MCEAGVPESTMLARMGHMSRAMLERYSPHTDGGRVAFVQAKDGQFRWGPHKILHSGATRANTVERMLFILMVSADGIEPSTY